MFGLFNNKEQALQDQHNKELKEIDFTYHLEVLTDRVKACGNDLAFKRFIQAFNSLNQLAVDGKHYISLCNCPMIIEYKNGKLINIEVKEIN